MIWDAKTGDLVKDLESEKEDSSSMEITIESVKFSTDSKRLLADVSY